MSSPEHECSVHGLTEYLPPDTTGRSYCKVCMEAALRRAHNRLTVDVFPISETSWGMSVGGPAMVVDGKIFPLTPNFMLDGLPKRP